MAVWQLLLVAVCCLNSATSARAQSSSTPVGVTLPPPHDAVTGAAVGSTATLWVSSTSGVDSPTCGSTQIRACATVQAAFQQCGFNQHCELTLQPGSYTGEGNLGLSMQRGGSSTTSVYSLAITSWPCALNSSNHATRTDRVEHESLDNPCGTAAPADIVCGTSDRGWLLSGYNVTLRGLRFQGCQNYWTSLFLITSYQHPIRMTAGAAIIVVDTTWVQLLDVTVRECTNGSAVAIVAGRLSSGERPLQNVSADFHVTVARCHFSDNTMTAVLVSACSIAKLDRAGQASTSCACNASVTVSDSRFSGNVRVLAASTTIRTAGGLGLLQVPVVQLSNLVFNVSAPNSVAEDLWREVDFGQVITIVDQTSTELCPYSTVTPLAPSSSVQVQTVSFDCSDDRLCAPSITDLRSDIVCTIIHDTDWPPTHSLASMQGVSFNGFFNSMSVLQVQSSSAVDISALRMVDSLLCSVLGWSVSLSHLDFQHVLMPPQDTFATSFFFGVQAQITFNPNSPVSWIDQFISIDNSRIATAVTPGLMVLAPGRFAPFSLILSNLTCALVPGAEELSGSCMQLLSTTARVVIAQCALTAARLDVLNVFAADSVFTVSGIRSAVITTVRPDREQSSEWINCQFIGGPLLVDNAGVAVACFASDADALRAKVSYTNCTFANHATTAFACVPANAPCLCSLEFRGSRFLDNTSPEIGGAIRLDFCTSAVTFGGNMRFERNRAQLAGGAIYFGTSCLLDFDAADQASFLFENNSVITAGGMGGAMFTQGSLWGVGGVVDIRAIGNTASFGNVLATYSVPSIGIGQQLVWSCVKSDHTPGLPDADLMLLNIETRPLNLSVYSFCNGVPAAPPGLPGSDITSNPLYLGVMSAPNDTHVVSVPTIQLHAGLPLSFSVALLDAYFHVLYDFPTWLLRLTVLNDDGDKVEASRADAVYAMVAGVALVDSFSVRYVNASQADTAVPLNFAIQLRITSESAKLPANGVASFAPSLRVPAVLLPCPPGTFLNVMDGVCVECSTGTYALTNNSRTCFICPEHAVCFANSVTAVDDYWLDTDAKTGVSSAYLCPAGFCTSGQCASNRDITSPLCARCLPDYYDWSGNCVRCDSANAAALTFLVLGLMVYVLLQHVLFQRGGAGPVKVFFFFFQTLQLMAQSTAHWLPVFVNVLNMQPSDFGSGSSCLYPASWYTRLLLQMIVPFALAAFLVLSFGLLKVIARIRGRSSLKASQDDDPVTVSAAPTTSQGSTGRASDPLQQSLLIQSDRGWIDSNAPADEPMHAAAITPHVVDAQALLLQPQLWSTLAVLRSLVAISLLAFQLWVFGVFSFLDCVPVGNHRVMSATPALDCDSAQYKRWAVFYYIMLIAALLLPVGLAVCFWKLKPYLQGGSAVSSDIKQRPTALLYILGVCYEGYRPEVFWFELVLLAQRLIFAVTGAITDLLWPGYPERRLEFLTLELALACLLQIRVKPFQLQWTNYFATGVLACLTVICHMATYYTLTVAASREDTGVQVGLVAVVMIPSCILLICAILYLLRMGSKMSVVIRRFMLKLDVILARLRGLNMNSVQETEPSTSGSASTSHPRGGGEEPSSSVTAMSVRPYSQSVDAWRGFREEAAELDLQQEME